MTLAIESCDWKELVALLMIKSGHGGKKPRSIEIRDLENSICSSVAIEMVAFKQS